MQTPCVWDADDSCRPASITDTQWEAAVDAASDILWALTGRQFGCCPRQVRPCREGFEDQGWLSMVAGWRGGRTWTPMVIGGVWYNLCGCSTSGCSCSCLCEIRIPAPVCSITDVWMDGKPLVEGTDYRVADGNRIIGINGTCWPWCQHLDQPLTEPETFGVDYLYGNPVPAAGRLATGALAAHLAVACDTSCKLPDHVTQVTMDGVAMTFDPAKYAEAGLTGLEIVDAWVKAVNPAQVARQSMAFSPDVPRPMNTLGWS